MVESNSILYAPGEKPDHTVSKKVHPIFEDQCKINSIILPLHSDCNQIRPLHHCNQIYVIIQVVIKYVPYVGDSKRAMDEYTSQIFMGGHNTIVLHNTCEDSLLAAPIILDLIILSELTERILVKKEEGCFERFHPVLSLLSYLLKAPMVPQGTPVVNALFSQRACIENVFR